MTSLPSRAHPVPDTTFTFMRYTALMRQIFGFEAIPLRGRNSRYAITSSRFSPRNSTAARAARAALASPSLTSPHHGPSRGRNPSPGKRFYPSGERSDA
jgi:hypothetical protein